jgi:hypothetical protein
MVVAYFYACNICSEEVRHLKIADLWAVNIILVPPEWIARFDISLLLLHRSSTGKRSVGTSSNH